MNVVMSTIHTHKTLHKTTLIIYSLLILSNDIYNSNL